MTWLRDKTSISFNEASKRTLLDNDIGGDGDVGDGGDGGGDGGGGDGGGQILDHNRTDENNKKATIGDFSIENMAYFCLICAPLQRSFRPEFQDQI